MTEGGKVLYVFFTFFFQKCSRRNLFSYQNGTWGKKLWESVSGCIDGKMLPYFCLQNVELLHDRRHFLGEFRMGKCGELSRDFLEWKDSRTSWRFHHFLTKKRDTGAEKSFVREEERLDIVEGRVKVVTIEELESFLKVCLKGKKIREEAAKRHFFARGKNQFFGAAVTFPTFHIFWVTAS